MGAAVESGSWSRAVSKRRCSRRASRGQRQRLPLRGSGGCVAEVKRKKAGYQQAHAPAPAPAQGAHHPPNHPALPHPPVTPSWLAGSSSSWSPSATEPNWKGRTLSRGCFTVRHCGRTCGQGTQTVMEGGDAGRGGAALQTGRRTVRHCVWLASAMGRRAACAACTQHAQHTQHQQAQQAQRTCCPMISTITTCLRLASPSDSAVATARAGRGGSGQVLL